MSSNQETNGRRVRSTRRSRDEGVRRAEILGAAIIGPDATNLITEYSLAMRAELTADEVLATIHPHPTYSEALKEATLAAEGRPIHIYLRNAAAARR